MWFCACAEARPLPETPRIPRRGDARGGDRKRLWFSATVEQLLSGGSQCSVPEAFRRDAALGRVSWSLCGAPGPDPTVKATRSSFWSQKLCLSPQTLPVPRFLVRAELSAKEPEA
ncbi:hypothetical protein MDA_GLEAN10002775 [Myotis davidii]|uniref:Uncharacterized protein n=1 Tax=Myotis davidii TaxID=225400 RepID=L5LC61_MYODS|nr:hypothetical protein MDA_GLEAN10002775 [Myotis davidii]